MGTGQILKHFHFADGENISANAGITHTTSYATDVASATTLLCIRCNATVENWQAQAGPALDWEWQ